MIILSCLHLIMVNMVFHWSKIVLAWIRRLVLQLHFFLQLLCKYRIAVCGCQTSVCSYRCMCLDRLVAKYVRLSARLQRYQLVHCSLWAFCFLFISKRWKTCKEIIVAKYYFGRWSLLSAYRWRHVRSRKELMFRVQGRQTAEEPFQIWRMNRCVSKRSFLFLQELVHFG